MDAVGGMVAVVEGSRDAGLVVTVMDYREPRPDNMKPTSDTFTERPIKLLRSPDHRAEGTNTELVNKPKWSQSGQRSKYRFQSAKAVSSSCVLRETTPQKYEFNQNSFTRVAPSREMDIFMSSLRRYPNCSEGVRSAEFVERLLAYTQAKNFSKSSYHTRSMRSLIREKNSKDTPNNRTRCNRNQQTYTRTRQPETDELKESNVPLNRNDPARTVKVNKTNTDNVVFTTASSRSGRKRPHSPAGETKFRRCKSSQLDQTYDYLNSANMPPQEYVSAQAGRTMEVRYLNDLTGTIRNVVRRWYEDVSVDAPMCSNMRDRYLHHQRYCQGRSEYYLDQETSPFDPMDYSLEGSLTSLTKPVARVVDYNDDTMCPKLYSRYLEHQKVCPKMDKANAQDSEVGQRTCPAKNKTCSHCNKLISCGSLTIPVCLKGKAVCECCDDTCECNNTYTHKIEREVLAWLHDIPVSANECYKNKVTRHQIGKELANKLISLRDDEDFETKAKREIDARLDEIPMWTPSDNDEKSAFKTKLSDDLLNRILNIREDSKEPINFESELAKFGNDLSLSEDNEGHPIINEEIIDKLLQILKEFASENMRDGKNFKELLKSKINEVLTEMSFQNEGHKDTVDHFANKLTKQIKKNSKSKEMQAADKKTKEDLVRKNTDEIETSMDDNSEETTTKKKIKDDNPNRKRKQSLDNEKTPSQSKSLKNKKVKPKNRNKSRNNKRNSVKSESDTNILQNRSNLYSNVTNNLQEDTGKSMFNEFSKLVPNKKINNPVFDHVSTVTLTLDKQHDTRRKSVDDKNFVKNIMNKSRPRSAEKHKTKRRITQDSFISESNTKLTRNDFINIAETLIDPTKKRSIQVKDQSLFSNYIENELRHDKEPKTINGLDNTYLKFSNRYEINDILSNIYIDKNLRNIPVLVSSKLENQKVKKLAATSQKINNQFPPNNKSTKMDSSEDDIIANNTYQFDSNGIHKPNENANTHKLVRILEKDAKIPSTEAKKLANTLINIAKNLSLPETKEHSSTLSVYETDFKPIEDSRQENLAKIVSSGNNKLVKNSKVLDQSNVNTSNTEDIDNDSRQLLADAKMRGGIDGENDNQMSLPNELASSNFSVTQDNDLHMKTLEYPKEMAISYQNKAPTPIYFQPNKYAESTRIGEPNNVEDYKRRIKKVINDWVPMLPINVSDSNFKETLTSNLVGDIIDRKKYLQLNPSAKTSDQEELDYLKYQVFRNLNKQYDIEDLTPLMPNIKTLMENLKRISVPQLVKSPKRESQIKPVYGDVPQDETYFWLKEVIPEYIMADNSKNNQEKIRELAKKLEEMKKRNASPEEIEKEINQWLAKNSGESTNKKNSIASQIITTKITVHKKASDFINNYVDDWCEELPIPCQDTPEEKEKIKTLKQNCASKLKSKIGELNMNPETFNDEFLYEDLLLDEIEQLVKDIPTSAELEASLPERKIQLIEKAKDARQLSHNELAGKVYKQQLKETVSKTLLTPKNLTPDQKAYLEVLKANLVDAFLNMNYCFDDSEVRDKYKRRMLEEIERFSIDLLDACPASVDALKVYQDLFDALQNVSIPVNQSLRPELEKTKMRDLVQEWIEELPLKDETGIEYLQRHKITSVLAQHLHDIEGEKNNISESVYEEKLQNEIMKHLKKFHLKLDDESKIEQTVKKLMDKIKYTENLRNFTITNYDNLEGKLYRQQVRDIISKILPSPENLSSEKQASFEILKENLADAFVTLNYSKDDDDLREMFKQKIYNEIERFCSEFLKRCPASPFNAKKINEDLFNALRNIPVPGEASLKSEVEQVTIKAEINKWMQELRLNKEVLSPTQRNKFVMTLTRRLHEKEKENEKNKDENHDDRMIDIIKKSLENLLKDSTEETNVDQLAKTLAGRLKNSQQSRSFISSNHNQEDKNVCPYHRISKGKHDKYNCSGVCTRPFPPTFLTAENRSHLIKIRERSFMNPSSNGLYRWSTPCDASVSPIPIDAASQTEYRQQTPEIYTDISCPGHQSISTQSPCKRASCGSQVEVSPNVIIKEYVWESPIARTSSKAAPVMEGHTDTCTEPKLRTRSRMASNARDTSPLTFDLSDPCPGKRSNGEPFTRLEYPELTPCNSCFKEGVVRQRKSVRSEQNLKKMSASKCQHTRNRLRNVSTGNCRQSVGSGISFDETEFMEGAGTYGINNDMPCSCGQHTLSSCKARRPLWAQRALSRVNITCAKCCGVHCPYPSCLYFR